MVRSEVGESEITVFIVVILIVAIIGRWHDVSSLRRGCKDVVYSDTLISSSWQYFGAKTCDSEFTFWNFKY